MVSVIAEVGLVCFLWSSICINLQ